MTYTQNLFFLMFVVGSDIDSNINKPNNQYTNKPHSKRYTKQINSKHSNLKMRSHHRISQPQWRGYSH